MDHPLGFVPEWNKKTAQAFPPDVVRSRDVIVRANDADNPENILWVLRTPGVANILVMARVEDRAEDRGGLQYIL